MHALKELGNKCFAEGKYAEAKMMYTKAIESGGADKASLAPVYSNRAACSIQQHLYDEAEVDAGNAILCDPTFIKGYYRRALARRELGKREEAAKDCETALEMLPGNADMRALLASCRPVLTCNICMEAYDCAKRYPVVLPCGHSTDHRVCRECFIALDKAVCPYDRAAFDVAAVQPDFTLLRSRLEPHDADGARRVEDLERSWVVFAPTHFNEINPLERELRRIERTNRRDHPELAWVLNDLGNAHMEIGCPLEARELYERALIIKERVDTLMNLGRANLNLGDAAKARRIFERVLIINEKQFGPHHPDVAATLTNLGSACGALGDFATAKGLVERALIIKEKHFGPNDTDIAITLMTLGSLCEKLGGAARAKGLLERALSIYERNFGLNHWEVANVLVNLGLACNSLGDAARAKGLFERALIIDETHFGLHHPNVANGLVNLSSACFEIGDAFRSKELLERALIIHEKHSGPHHEEVASVLEKLGIVCDKLGDAARAKEFRKRASLTRH